MASPAVQNPVTANGESKSAKKKKAKAGSAPSPAVPDAPVKEDSSLDAKGDSDTISEHPYIKELSKHIRNAHKKLSGMQKTDSVIAENPGLSLDELVAQRKINADQKAAALKKPQIQQQLATLEEQITLYRKFDSDYQAQLQKQKEDLTSQHQKDLEKVKEDSRVEGVTTGADELRKKLLVFTQFLRAAAHKRTIEEEVETEESRAFEGALLLVYGGDDKAVETAVKLIEGSEEQVPSIESLPLNVKYSQVKQASIDHAPFQAEESWVDSVAEANATTSDTPAAERSVATDPTIAHAGLTELDTSGKPNGVPAEPALDAVTSPPQTGAGDEAGNAAGDRWDASAAGAEQTSMEDSYEVINRSDGVEDPLTAAPATAEPEKTSWADEPPAYDAAPTGNAAAEGWDTKAAGEQTDDNWNGEDAAAAAGASGWVGDTTSGPSQEDSDGFHQVAGRHRGRGGRGRGGDGEFRGRGRGRGGFRGDFRGDGEFRGRGRGGFRGGRGEMGEFRGRGGRGRGSRGGAEGQPRGA